MKSKHIATYGKETANSGFDNYHCFDIVFHKSTITAPARTVIDVNYRLRA